MRLILILTLATLLSSCSLSSGIKPSSLDIRKEEPGTPRAIEPLSVLMEAHRNLTICCKSFKEFSYTQLNLPDTKTFKIDKHSKASSFDTGKSFFISFTLPEFSSPYTIKIKSYEQSENLTDSYIFSPVLIFLNKNHQILRKVIRGLFEYTGDVADKPLTPGASLTGKINITHEKKDYRYMIVLTPGKTLGKAHEHSPAKNAPAALTGKKVPLIHAPTGRLKIDLY